MTEGFASFLDILFSKNYFIYLLALVEYDIGHRGENFEIRHVTWPKSLRRAAEASL